MAAGEAALGELFTQGTQGSRTGCLSQCLRHDANSSPSESLCSGDRTFKDGINFLKKKSHWDRILRRRDQDTDKHREDHTGTG